MANRLAYTLESATAIQALSDRFIALDLRRPGSRDRVRSRPTACVEDLRISGDDHRFPREHRRRQGGLLVSMEPGRLMCHWHSGPATADTRRRGSRGRLPSVEGRLAWDAASRDGQQRPGLRTSTCADVTQIAPPADGRKSAGVD